MLAIPALCDLVGSGLAAVGYVYLDSALWQMLRSSIIIFSAILSVILLKRRLQPFHWVATAIVFSGLVLGWLASVLDAREAAAKDNKPGKTVSPSEMLMGIALVVGAQLCSAFQMVFEEKLLVGGPPTSAKKVVGVEGVWGCLVMLVVLIVMSLLPGKDHGRFESAAAGLYMIERSPRLLTLVPTFMCSIALYNLVGITVGKRMSAVVRCLVDASRTVVVWGLSLVMFYYVSEELGDGWKTYTWLTMIGFVVLVCGTLLYNDVLPAPACLRHQEDKDPDGQEARPAAKSFVSTDGVLCKVDLTQEGAPRVIKGSARSSMELGSSGVELCLNAPTSRSRIQA